MIFSTKNPLDSKRVQERAQKIINIKLPITQIKLKHLMKKTIQTRSIEERSLFFKKNSGKLNLEQSETAQIQVDSFIENDSNLENVVHNEKESFIETENYINLNPDLEIDDESENSDTMDIQNPEEEF